MKKTLPFAIIVLFLGSQTFAFLPIGGVPGEGLATAAAVQSQTIMQKIEFALTRIELIKQAKIMYDNYVQSRQYYDMIKEASKHRGGLLGYYQERFMNRLTDSAYDEWARIQEMKYGDPNNMVRQLVEGGEKRLETKMDRSVDQWIDNMEKEMKKGAEFMDKQTEQLKSRTDQLKKLVNSATSDSISDKQRDSYSLQAQILTVEYLHSIDQSNNAFLLNQFKDLQRQFAMVKRNQMTARSFSKTMEEGMERQHRGGRRDGRISEQQIQRVLEETPK